MSTRHGWIGLALALCVVAPACSSEPPKPAPATAAPAPAPPPEPRVKVYVTNEMSGDLTVVDADRQTAIGTYPLGKRPRGIKVSPDRKSLYVALSGSPNAGPGVDPKTLPPPDRSADGIGEVDTTTYKVKRIIHAGNDPEPKEIGTACGQGQCSGPGLVIPAIADHPGVAGVGDHEAPRRKDEGERTAQPTYPTAGSRLSGSLRLRALCYGCHAFAGTGRRRPANVSTTPTIVKTMKVPATAMIGPGTPPT